MSELKPCPFCGGSNVKDEPALQVVICMDCGAEKDTDLGEWNTRPIEDALTARIAELELRLDVYNGNMYDVVVDENAKANKRIAELEAEIERFTAHDATERQDDKWIPEVQE